ncbi:MAG: glycerol-3-phosphate 1-O-acyltransferase PlsY [Erysipelotrichales bacterium]
MEIIKIIMVILMGYLIGSIPFALIIGKLFYNTDIRESGSGNLGGTNAARTLGKTTGIIVMLLDISKAFVAITIATLLINKFSINIDPNYVGLACVVGHCYPVFAGFKGGKGVACTAGFILAINPILLLIALVILIINLKVHHMMSLGVIIAIVTATILSFVFPMFENTKVVLFFLTLFITFQHRENIKRIIDGTENKIKWI